jgi:23S rRNA pseudouridine2605 synthase|tara:strand:- start:21291 stop:22016 length:726 start_codon:yes stop_codon:yes gene_type:complete
MNKNSDELSIRLNKFIAKSGLCSRREADVFISNGRVSVNDNKVIKMGILVNKNDLVKVDNKRIFPEKKIYVLLNKPKDFITTNKDTHNRKIVINLIKGVKERIFPVGRLDRKTTGLLLLTNDGELAKKLIHPSHKIKKIYSIELDKPITKTDFNKINDGIKIDNEKINFDKITLINNKKELGVEIHIGKNRIIRKIFESLNYKVIKLDRVMFGPLTKKDLPRGKWKFLDQKELRLLKNFTK